MISLLLEPNAFLKLQLPFYVSNRIKLLQIARFKRQKAAESKLLEIKERKERRGRSTRASALSTPVDAGEEDMDDGDGEEEREVSVCLQNSFVSFVFYVSIHLCRIQFSEAFLPVDLFIHIVILQRTVTFNLWLFPFCMQHHLYVVLYVAFYQ